MKRIIYISALIGLVALVYHCINDNELIVYQDTEEIEAPDTEEIQVKLPGCTHPHTVSVQKIDGDYIYDGDMIVFPYEEDDPEEDFGRGGAILKGDGDGRRHGGSHGQWPKAIIPYQIVGYHKVSSIFIKNVKKAISHVNEVTNICMVPYNEDSSKRAIERELGENVPFLEIKEIEANNYIWGRATVGYVDIPRFIHYLQIDPESSYRTYLHELAHVIGMIHEHSRDDRDKYITVTEGVDEKDEFKSFSAKVLDKTDFDFKSISFYPIDQLSAQGTPVAYRLTQSAKDDNDLWENNQYTQNQENNIGRIAEFSPLDIQIVEQLYVDEITKREAKDSVKQKLINACRVDPHSSELMVNVNLKQSDRKSKKGNELLNPSTDNTSIDWGFNDIQIIRKNRLYLSSCAAASSTLVAWADEVDININEIKRPRNDSYWEQFSAVLKYNNIDVFRQFKLKYGEFKLTSPADLLQMLKAHGPLIIHVDTRQSAKIIVGMDGNILKILNPSAFRNRKIQISFEELKSSVNGKKIESKKRYSNTKFEADSIKCYFASLW